MFLKSLGNKSERVVKLLKTASDLGLELVGRSSTGVYVKDLVPGGPAHRAGELAAGDQVVWVNDVNTGETVCGALYLRSGYTSGVGCLSCWVIMIAVNGMYTYVWRCTLDYPGQYCVVVWYMYGGCACVDKIIAARASFNTTQMQLRLL